MKTKVAVLLSMLGLALAGVTQKVCSRKSCPFHITFTYRKHSILLKLKPRGYQNQFSTLDMELLKLKPQSLPSALQSPFAKPQLPPLKNALLHWRLPLTETGLASKPSSTTRSIAGEKSPLTSGGKPSPTSSTSHGRTPTLPSPCHPPDTTSTSTISLAATRSGPWAEEEPSQMLSPSTTFQRTSTT